MAEATMEKGMSTKSSEMKRRQERKNNSDRNNENGEKIEQ